VPSTGLKACTSGGAVAGPGASWGFFSPGADGIEVHLNLQFCWWGSNCALASEDVLRRRLREFGADSEHAEDGGRLTEPGKKMDTYRISTTAWWRNEKFGFDCSMEKSNDLPEQNPLWEKCTQAN
jgi:hypothetical protein